MSSSVNAQARRLQVAPTLLLATVAAIVVAYKAWSIEPLPLDPMFAAYGLVIAAYLLLRFSISFRYRPGPDRGIEPTVAVVMPAFNEEDAVGSSIESILGVEYPRGKLEVIAVNDGSTDGTGAALDAIAAKSERVSVLHFEDNRGKRAAMAAGIRQTTAEVLVFVDSDSVLAPDAIRAIVQDFAEPDVGAVAGHTDVLNQRDSWLTRMQAVWYFIAFRVHKAFESRFRAVTCCSGCFSAYRRVAILPHLEEWEQQTFLGRPATVGDDRSLTNFVLRDWKTLYQSRAVSATIVPADLRKFLIQQARWKRSWVRESLILGCFIWRKARAAALATYVSIVLPLLAPFVLARALFWQPLVEGLNPAFYVGGICAVATMYGLYHASWHGLRDSVWIFGMLFIFVYLAFLVWQTYYAIVTIRRTRWGTRGAAPLAPAPERV
jgi:hyaluronan synthase